jgi:acyl-CoA synthetase (AMP-forming)/AMP-acid ligase II
MQYYGQTEVVGTSLFKEHHQPDGEPHERARLLSVGIPFANTLVKIVDEHGVECPAGVPGEVLMKSAMMFRGYWNDEAATRQTIRDGWCHTGDVGKLDAEGFLYLVDRLKDVIISGGENIYSREVEEAVLQHPGVSEVAVIGRPDPTWGEAVCAVVVAKPGAEVSESDLIEHAKTLIASYKKPRSVVFVEELPKLPSGKVNKVALRQQLVATT